MTDTIKSASITIECPKCKSRSLSIDFSTETLLYCQPFTDDDGRLHHHDINTTTTHCTCKKCRHSFTKSHTGSCWCGWEADIS